MKRKPRIEKSVPMTQQKRPAATIYPWHDMKVDDSFLVPLAKRNAVYVAANDFGKRHGKKFTVRTTDEGVRVWRTK